MGETIRRFGNPDGKNMLLHGNLMCRRQTDKLTAYIRENCGGRLDLLFGGIARLWLGGVPKPGG